MSTAPPEFQPSPRPRDNQDAVASLILHRIRTSGLHPRDVYRANYVPLFNAPGKSSPNASSSSSQQRTNALPPPGCPMHAGGAAASTTSGAAPPSSRFATVASSSQPVPAASPPPAAPAAGASGRGGLIERLNPLNYMPDLAQAPVSEKQKVHLPTERTLSSIPRAINSAPPGASPYDKPAAAAAGADASACPVPHDVRESFVKSQAGGASDGGAAQASVAAAAAATAATTTTATEQAASNWEYPSPQQFYNALVRKGWETPEEHVEMMVLVHNFLNERAWTEVCRWEKSMGVDPNTLSLARFQGRPGTLSPKARLLGWAAWIAPSRFSSEAPFDRHDWVVRRPPTSADAAPKEVRYVIDYYQSPDEDDPDKDEAVFHLDVRPALDTWEAARARLRNGWEWRSDDDGDAAAAAGAAAGGNAAQ